MKRLTKEKKEQLVKDFSPKNFSAKDQLVKEVGYASISELVSDGAKKELMMALGMIEAVVSSYQMYHDELVKATKIRTDSDILNVLPNAWLLSDFDKKELISLTKRLAKKHIEESAVTLRSLKRIRTVFDDMPEEAKEKAYALTDDSAFFKQLFSKK